jgi:O-antigen/teichoic acid export membrane protein
MQNRANLFSVSSLRNDTFFYGIATLSERGISFLIIPLLTKSISQELYGIWTQIIITAALVSNIILMGFHTAAVRFLAGGESRQESSSLFHAMLAIVLANGFIVIALAFLFTSPFTGLVFKDVRFSNFIPLLSYFLISEAIFELVAAFLRAQNKIILLSFYYFIKSSLKISILAIGLLALHIELYQTILGMIAMQVVLIIFIYVKDILMKVGLSISIWNIRWKTIMFFSLPLVPYSMLIWANNFVDRYVILHLLDIKQVSIYAVAYSFAAIVGLFYSVIGFTLYPYLAKLWNEGDKIGAAKTLKKAMEYYLFCVIPFIALISVLSDPIIKIFSKSDYLSNWLVIFCLGVGIGVFGLYQLNIYSTLLANKTFLNVKLSAVSLSVNVLLNIILVPIIGILGASIATLLSNSVLALWIIRIGKQYLPYIFPWKLTIKIIMATFIMSSILLVVKEYVEISNLWILIFFIALGSGIYGTIDLLNKYSLLIRLRRNL